jgi:outer membrane protein assembly factor BamA
MKRFSSLPACITPFALVCVCSVSSATRVSAQTKQTALAQIAVEGSARFSDSQISAASGLKLGQPADDFILTAALDRLSNTGAFSEITYRYKTTSGKMAVTFIVVDEPKTMACTFDNFIWFSPDEEDRAVRNEVPLYDGRVPLQGNLAQAVAAALEHLLAQHHLAATVTFLPAAKTLGTAPTEFRFSAKDNLPPVTSVEFTGPLELEVIYKNHAYLRAHFSDPQVTFVPGQNDSDPGSVKLVFTVVPGAVYSWHGADWDGNTAYSSADLEHYLAMKDGVPAAFDKISAGMDALRDAYGAKGYIAVSLSTKQTFDDEASKVHYSFQIKEGNRFHMGGLTISGFDDKTDERIRKAWRLKMGDLYDASYLKEFGKKDLSEALTGSPAVVRSGRISFSTRPNQGTLMVDVAISLSSN